MDSNSPQRSFQSASLRRLDLSLLIQDVCDSYQQACNAQDVRVVIDVPSNLWVDLDAILFREAIRKLTDNALEAMPDGGVLTITSLIGRHGLEVEFADSGTGIPDELHGRLFDPFATNKPDHAGLGLSMVRDIAAAHGGSVSAQDCPDCGSAFTLLIPLRETLHKAA